MGPVVAGLRTLAAGGLKPPPQVLGGILTVMDMFKLTLKAPQCQQKYPRKPRAGMTMCGILVPSSGSRLRPTPHSSNLSKAGRQKTSSILFRNLSHLRDCVELNGLEPQAGWFGVPPLDL